MYWDLDLSQDYSASEGTVTITSNAGSFTITPNADSATEGAETDTIRLYQTQEELHKLQPILSQLTILQQEVAEVAAGQMVQVLMV